MLQIKIRKVNISQEWEPEDRAWVGFLINDGVFLRKLDKAFSSREQALSHYRQVEGVISVQ